MAQFSHPTGFGSNDLRIVPRTGASEDLPVLSQATRPPNDAGCGWRDALSVLVLIVLPLAGFRRAVGVDACTRPPPTTHNRIERRKA